MDINTRPGLDWEELISAGIEARQASDQTRWKLGDLALQVDSRYGEHTLEQYAKSIGVPYDSLRRYRDISKAYEAATRVASLSWTHHRVMAAEPDRLEWLKRAVEAGWSAARTRQEWATAWVQEQEKGGEANRAEQKEMRKLLREEVREHLAQGGSKEEAATYLTNIQLNHDNRNARAAAGDVWQDRRLALPTPFGGTFIPSNEEYGRIRNAPLTVLNGLLWDANKLVDHFPPDVAASVGEHLKEPQDDDALTYKQLADLGDIISQVDLLIEWLSAFREELPKSTILEGKGVVVGDLPAIEGEIREV
jgi:hypothetical protein